MNPIILIVDDHGPTLLSLKSWLELDYHGCRVVEAASGEEAVSLAVASMPSLVLMDVALPGINGIEATRQIKALLPATHIVMLSIDDNEAYRLLAASAGASAYVSKWRMQTELQPMLDQMLALAGPVKNMLEKD
jgi:DNA-binding NarL/FixJ family response regulator